MTIETRRDILIAVRERYKKATKKNKTKILDEFCETCSYKSRKHAIAILNGQKEPRQRSPGPKPVYNQNFVFHLVALWRLMGYMCSKKMVEALPLWIGFYRDPTFNDGISTKLLSVSSATIDRLLKPYRHGPRRGLSATQGTHLLKNQIPIELFKGNIDRPGFCEADTVAHCGDSLEGAYANSLTVTDIKSCWTENRAIWRKDAESVLAQFKDIEQNLPFLMTHISTDNGNEFLNKLFVNYCHNRGGGRLKFTRKRPYKKNDSAHVEQKNWTHVRQLFGYSRVEDPAIVVIMNEIYRAYWSPLMNFFNPVMKLQEKIRIGAKIKKKYDLPKTPYQRLMDCEHVPKHMKDQLTARYRAINPFDLKQRLEKRLDDFRKLVKHRETSQQSEITAA